MSGDKFPNERLHDPILAKQDVIDRLGILVPRKAVGSNFADFKTSESMLFVERPGRIPSRPLIGAAARGDNPFIINVVDRLPRALSPDDRDQPGRAQRHAIARLVVNESDQQIDLNYGYLELVAGSLGAKIREKFTDRYRGHLGAMPERIYRAVLETTPGNRLETTLYEARARDSWMVVRDYRTSEEIVAESEIGSQFFGAIKDIVSNPNIPVSQLMHGGVAVTCFAHEDDEGSSRGFIRMHSDFNRESAFVYVEDTSSGLADQFEIIRLPGQGYNTVRHHITPPLSEEELEDWSVASLMSYRQRSQAMHLEHLFDGGDQVFPGTANRTLEMLRLVPEECFLAPK